MSAYDADKLYQLLPAIYRVRDEQTGGQLRALIEVIASQAQVMEEDIARLYDNWFIETCDPWVVPYIGDLLGIRGMRSLASAQFSLRSYVANALAYRQRKGTALVLEQLAHDVTGWPARVVEFFQLLTTSQNINHLRPGNLWVPDLRHADDMELLGGPFESMSHSADVRPVSTGGGRYNIPNIGLFLWRLKSYRLTWVVAYSHGNGRYSFSPIGVDGPLFNKPQTEIEILHLADEPNLPCPLRSRLLFEELEARRSALVQGSTPESVYFGDDPVLEIYLDFSPGPSNPEDLKSLDPEEIIICDLSGWDSPGWTSPQSQKYPKAGDLLFSTKVAVDADLGRLAILSGFQHQQPSRILVSYSYGFSGDMGGGQYDRLRPLLSSEEPLPLSSEALSRADVLIPVSLNGKIKTISDALNDLKPDDPRTIIQIEDNQTYPEDLSIAMDGGDLVIQSANHPDHMRPTLVGNLEVTGGSDAARLVISGLVIAGRIYITGSLAELKIVDCTLVPGRWPAADDGAVFLSQPSIMADASCKKLRIENSITGPLWLHEELADLVVRDSIIASSSPMMEEGFRRAITGREEAKNGPRTTIERSTIFGSVYVKELALASEVIFNHPVSAQRRQSGCIRFSYIPDEGSLTPRRYHCQPDLALANLAREKGIESLDEGEKALVLSVVRPAFTSTRYGDPGYAQLSPYCAPEIRTGGTDGSEMGAFSYLMQPQRESNLRAALNEYLRAGLEAGIFYVT